MDDEQTTEPPADQTPVEPSTPVEPAPVQRVEDLPDWAQKVIRDARADAASHRTKANTAAQDAEKGLTERLATALGLKADATPNPAALTEQLTAAQQASRDAAIQLAVFRAAGTHQGNPDALLDSKAFLAKVSGLDPAAGDFSTQVSDAIKGAVTANPTLRLVQAATASTTDHAGGSGESGPITEQQLNQMTPEQIDKAHREGRLNHLLGL